MTDRDFIWPTPPWRLMLPFVSVSMLTIFYIASTTVFIGVTFKTEPHILIPSMLAFGFFFCFINVQISKGSYSHAKILQYIALLFCLLALVCNVITNNKHFFLYAITTIMEISSFFIIRSRYYQGGIYYRMRHTIVMYKIYNDERLDDGKFYHEN